MIAVAGGAATAELHAIVILTSIPEKVALGKVHQKKELSQKPP
jgi:hypothetical protein